MAHDYFEPSPLTFMGSQRPLARRIGRPVLTFLRIEASGGIILILATIVALVWANSPWSDGYHTLLETHINIEIGDLLHLDEPIEAWVNDALMAIFFFVVGLEIKRELVAGELRDPRAAALPAMAAFGGMAIPALVFVAINAGGEGVHGWGIPMATDIAFAIGIVSLLGNRVPASLKVFLLTLAIVDDIGAILVIAIFYSSDISLGWLAVAGATVLVVVGMRLAHVWYTPVYVAVGGFLWLAVFESGVHATIAGVILGLLTPARPLRTASPKEAEAVSLAINEGANSGPVVRRASFEIRETVSVAERLQTLLHPFSSFVIIPIFALVNAGIELSNESISEAATSPLTLGVIAGLVVGKLIGVSLFTFIGVKLGVSDLPGGASWTQVLGISAVAGIGFTVSLFIAGLAFEEQNLIDDAKIGILVASTIAAILGLILLSRSDKAAPIDAQN